MLSLLAKIGLDISPFRRGLNAAEAAGKRTADVFARDIGPSLKAGLFGAVSAGTVVRIVSGIFDLAKGAKEASVRLGVGAEDAQRIELAAQLAGANTEDLAAALGRIAQLRAKVLAGDEASLAALRSLGVSAADFGDRSVTNLQILQRITAAATAGAGGFAGQAAAMQLVGEKVTLVADTLERLKSLGGVKVLDDSQIEDLQRAAAEIEIAKRSLAASAAPVASFWARVLNRGSQMEREEGSELGRFTFTRAAWREFWDEGPTRSEPLTNEDVLRARMKLPGFGGPGVPPEVAESSPLVSSFAARGERLPAVASRPAVGGLAEVGLFFGGAGNPLLREARRQSDGIERAVAELQRVRNAIREEL